MHRVNSRRNGWTDMGPTPRCGPGRMRAAIDLLEAAIERRRRHDARRADADEEFAVMQDDRARLAVELDGAPAGNRALSAANAAAAERDSSSRARPSRTCWPCEVWKLTASTAGRERAKIRWRRSA